MADLLKPIPVGITDTELAELRKRADDKGKTLAQHVRAKLKLPQRKLGRPCKSKS